MNTRSTGKAKPKDGGEDVRSKALRMRTGTKIFKESVIKRGWGRGRGKGSATGSLGPPRSVVYIGNGWAGCKTHQCALSALSRINEEEQGPKYKLVEPLQCIRCPSLFRHTFLYHCNFIARPENGSADDDTLFFAELEGKQEKTGGQITLTLLFWCILGPCDSGGDCENCGALPGWVKHPKSDGFHKFVEPGAVLW
ncbi:unnamed protein product [Cuscuta epithymum]|uniref:DUF3615 domain-containing protein n=1 Tax=Cuscuta epithymum TaxID=186058 RepID=A0AAV0ELE8_9ASTE|nr:unnamed protein product [Cuscuta epithymum]